MAWSYTESGNNTENTSQSVNYPAYADGDLLIVQMTDVQYAGGTQSITYPSGPNSETITHHIDHSRADTIYEPVMHVGYFIGDGSHAAGSLAVTTSINTRWTACVTKVPSGEFDPIQPLSTSTSTNSASSGSTLTLSALVADTDDGGGTLVALMGSDQDPISGVDAGWTDQVTTDRGRATIKISTRDAAITNSETTGTPTWTIAGDAWAIVGFIVRAFVNDPPTVALNTPADTGSTASTTPSLVFTGTDADDDTIRYQIQIDTVNTFDGN